MSFIDYGVTPKALLSNATRNRRQPIQKFEDGWLNKPVVTVAV